MKQNTCGIQMFSQKRVILQDGCNILGKNSRVQLTVGVRGGWRWREG